MYGEETTDCWFDEPDPADRRSWAVPPAHGIYQGLDLELLDPGNEDERTFLIEAQHPEFAAALRGDEDVVVDGEPVNPRLHVAMHQIVANQLLADDPPETWHTVQRLDRLGYDWHNIMHMITSLVSEDVYRSLKEHRQPDPGAAVDEGGACGDGKHGHCRPSGLTPDTRRQVPGPQASQAEGRRFDPPLTTTSEQENARMMIAIRAFWGRGVSVWGQGASGR